MTHPQGGKSRRSRFSAASGRHLRSVPLGRQGRDIRLDYAATLVAGLLRHGAGFSLNQLRLQDLRQKVFRKKDKSLFVFVVDASDSMGEGTVARMKAAKGAILGWLTAAYQQRDQVALIAFRGHRANLLLPPTTSILLARQRLRQLAVGGATPLADGLAKAGQLVRIARQKQPGIVPLVIVVSDGDANVPLSPGVDVTSELLTLAHLLRGEQLRTMIVDTHAGARGSALLRRLAGALEGRYRHVRELTGRQLLDLIWNEKEKNNKDEME